MATLNKEAWVTAAGLLTRFDRFNRFSISDLVAFGMKPWSARTAVVQMRELGYLVDCGLSLKAAKLYSAHPELTQVTKRWADFGFPPEPSKLAVSNTEQPAKVKSVHDLPVYTGPVFPPIREGSDAAFKIKSKGVNDE